MYQVILIKGFLCSIIYRHTNTKKQTNTSHKIKTQTSKILPSQNMDSLPINNIYWLKIFLKDALNSDTYKKSISIHDVKVILKNKWNYVKLIANLSMYSLMHIQLIGTVILA